ncbi:MAG: hypothetical protein QNJ29_08050, partial [Rhizobiaceae bacterium]|nr:hypothetical protein [Rhizobiaceae bacterium]
MFKFFAVQPVKAALVSGAFLVLGFSVSPLANESSRFGVLSTEISRKIVEGIEEARQERIATWQARISGSHDAFPEDDKEVRENADLEPENSYQIADNKRIERPDFLKENKDEG